ncbi:hypothetical protein [Actinomadura geliboluensis]|uniref:hypothetical protein n=1 Tax=Actinomadura geliboluensis TaxID=882440 RepID=UPI00262EA596|nr:hypothetical protein [Actinomadura geliboluensis]
MAISGSFQTSARYVGYRPDARGTARNWGTGVDPDHGDREVPHGFPPPAPVHRLESPPFIEDMFDVSRTPPGWADADTETGDFHGTRPVEQSLDQHDVPTLPWGVRDDDRLRQMSGRAHSAQKRVLPSQMATKVARGFADRIESVRLQSLPQTPMGTGGGLTGQALRALRGRNSLAVNNPGVEDGPDTGNYVRQGWELSRWTDRPMRRRGLSHTKRELHVNVAETGVDSPGLPGPYTSPFSSWGSLRVGTARPGVRREPRPWDEDVVDDFTAGGAGQFVGGF